MACDGTLGYMCVYAYIYIYIHKQYISLYIYIYIHTTYYIHTNNNCNYVWPIPILIYIYIYIYTSTSGWGTPWPVMEHDLFYLIMPGNARKLYTLFSIWRVTWFWHVCSVYDLYFVLFSVALYEGLICFVLLTLICFVLLCWHFMWHFYVCFVVCSMLFCFIDGCKETTWRHTLRLPGRKTIASDRTRPQQGTYMTYMYIYIYIYVYIHRSLK